MVGLIYFFFDSMASYSFAIELTQWYASWLRKEGALLNQSWVQPNTSVCPVIRSFLAVLAGMIGGIICQWQCPSRNKESATQ